MLCVSLPLAVPLQISIFQQHMSAWLACAENPLFPSLEAESLGDLCEAPCSTVHTLENLQFTQELPEK